MDHGKSLMKPDKLETRGELGYHWWDFRVEIDDADGKEVAANTFGAKTAPFPKFSCALV